MGKKGLFPAATLLLVAATLHAQDEGFPEGEEGELYYCPRIDLVPEMEGGPLFVEPDGILDEEAWARAQWQGWSNTSDMPRGDPLPPDFVEVSPEADLSFEWAALCDLEFLYVAWRITDDALQNIESFQCDSWMDDSVEIYIDAKNDGPECLQPGNAHCYDLDDAQITVGAENIGQEDPSQLVFGGVAGKMSCDFSGPHPEVAQGVVREVRDPDEDVYIGWEAEVAIALETLGNFDDGTPEWIIEPEHGRVIGWNIHGQDDDDGGGRDHKLIWSLQEVTESAWRNPGSFGKMMFVDPTQEPPPLLSPVSDVTCTREEDGTVTVTWTNPASADPATPTSIEVDGTEVTTVAGDAESVELGPEQVPLDDQDHVVTVINNSLTPVECDVLGSPFDECGGIRLWNILGAYDNPGGAAPGEDAIRLDYMTDGEVEEIDFEWAPGAAIETDFAGAAASTFIDGGAAGRNPGGLPTVFSRFGKDARVNFQSGDAFGSDLESVMAYAQTYIIAEEETELFLGVSSDDSVQVLLNGVEVWINNIPRPSSDACVPDDHVFDPVLLEEGPNSLIVKIFEGGGDWAFAVRFEDELQNPVTEGLQVRLSLPDEPPPITFIRGDIDASQSLNITDAIVFLGWQFLGDSAPPCLDAADVDDSGSHNITDAIFLLQFQFLGTAPPPDPGPTPGEQLSPGDCGTDPTADELDCAEVPPLCRG